MFAADARSSINDNVLNGPKGDVSTLHVELLKLASVGGAVAHFALRLPFGFLL